MAYFGVYLTPYAIDFIFLETGDIMTEIKDVWYKYLYVFALVGVPYFILGYIVARDFLNRVSFKYGWILPAVYFAGFFYRASTPDGIFQMLFKNTCYASFNTVNSFSAYLGNILPRKLAGYEHKENFPDYKLTNIATDTKNRSILFLLSANQLMSIICLCSDITAKRRPNWKNMRRGILFSFIKKRGRPA